ncbi:MAG: ABC transporter permease subunit [Aggregatilineales bacterium]
MKYERKNTMRGAIFTSTLQQSIWQMLYWGIGLSAMAVLVVTMAPLFNAMDFVGLLENMPPILIKSLGVGDDITVLGTPEGIIAFGFFGKMALLFVVYPVVMGMRVTSNEEGEGILDMVLSLPIDRRSVIIERFAAYIVTVIIIGLMITAGFVIGAGIVDIELDVTLLMIISLNLIPALVFVLALTVMMGAIIGKQRLALGIVTGFVIVSFMFQTLGGMIDGTLGDIINGLSFFTYNSPGTIIQNGVNPMSAILLFGLSIIMLGIALFQFERRDIAV